MSDKKRSNKELNEDLAALTVKVDTMENEELKALKTKVTIIENIMKDLHTKFNNKKEENYSIQNIKVEERIAEVEEKMESFVVKVDKLEEKVIKLDAAEKDGSESQPIHPKLACSLCDFVHERKSELKKHKVENHKEAFKLKHCKICSETFLENWLLEAHMKSHSEAEEFDCKTCGKTFMLKWRLRKHLNVHITEKYCHYFNNQKECPFEVIGCKFRHESSPECRFKQSCENSMCQYKHKKEHILDDCEIGDKDEANLSKKRDDDTKCELCDKECMTEEILKKHLENHKAEEDQDKFSKFLQEKQKNMKNMNMNELFGLVEVIKNRS